MANSKEGLIYGCILDGQGSGRVIDWPDIDQWAPEQGIAWLHLNYTSEQARDWLEHESGLDSLVIDALLTEESRPRTTQLAGGLLIALRGVNHSPGSDPEDMVGIRIWSDGQRIISTRRRKLLSVGDVIARLEAGDGPQNIGEFLVILSDRLITRMGATIDDTEDQVAAIEDQILSTDSDGLRSQITSLRRMVIALRRYLAPQREAMAQMQALRGSLISNDDQQKIREVTDHLIRYLEDLDSVRDRAAVAHEELANRLTEQMNSRMYVLSLVAAVFLPLGFFTGLLGINVGGIPGAENPWSFGIFCALLVAIVTIQIWIFKKKKWF
ncbi:zinc transporter ZntB [Photobacterium lipolyticum]|uniref:Zinc transporter ZntB n=1 Tax=Photobacterium lipolyticum TaxID=266810 RepID=A0A2T3MZU5_9GAMM|nr:zinc transporter ZntB [Photobacterium lipolyticum]PSW05497.1 zinc transporter ZntB [Photobacterium lipolyticum]